jgi:hypothetical protein
MTNIAQQVQDLGTDQDLEHARSQTKYYEECKIVSLTTEELSDS